MYPKAIPCAKIVGKPHKFDLHYVGHYKIQKINNKAQLYSSPAV